MHKSFRHFSLKSSPSYPYVCSKFGSMASVT